MGGLITYHQVIHLLVYVFHKKINMKLCLLLKNLILHFRATGDADQYEIHLVDSGVEGSQEHVVH